MAVSPRALQGLNNATKSPLAKVVFLILGILLLFPLYRFVMRQLAKNQEATIEAENDMNYLENQNPVTAQTKADRITTRKDVQNAARQLAHHLGTMYSDTNSWFDWLNPRGWTENDEEVRKILILQRYNFRYLERLYNEVYTNNLNLRNDVLRLLDKDELAKVQRYNIL